MSDNVRCTRCAAELPSGSPGGLCPSCLLRLALDGTGGTEEAEGSTVAAPSGSASPEQLGTIGPYRLLSVLGEGGMGSVYLAEQSEPIRRRVALKIIKRGMDTREVIARFESERQALALMSHPNIARVLDAGATKEGLPYFVMEHVAGIPITDYCDKNRLDSGQRLELFEEVCEAVQHAHQKGIIHRDFKPSNVLVSEEDGKARPRIIDFGVAKAINQRLTEKTLFTQRGMIVGTPGYMSPEQADPTALDVDTRTDIYSLGVLLYELVAGVPPFDPRRLLSAGWGEMQRIIREEEPPKPSTRVSKLGDTATGIAELRRASPATLQKELSGEIDWITLKALAKSPARRYASASELAADVRRHLSNEPVLAGPPSAWYRASTYARRHRIGVAFGSSMALLLLAFAVAMTVMAARLARERDRASQEAATAKEVERFLLGMFENPNPEVSRGEKVTARELLDRGVAEVDKLGAEPRVQVRLLIAMYRSYEGLGLLSRSEAIAGRALAIHSAIPGADPKITRGIRFDLAGQRRDIGSFEEALNGFQALCDEEVAAGRADALEAHEALLGVAVTLERAGRHPEAEERYRKAIAGLQRVAGRDHRRTLEALTGLAATRATLGDFVEAEALCRAAYEGYVRVLGLESPVTSDAAGSLGYALMQLGRFSEAEPLQRGAYEQQRRMLGDEHPGLISPTTGMGTLLQSMERYAEAEVFFRRSVAIATGSLGPEHPTGLLALNNLGVVLMLQQRWADALEPVRHAYTSARQTLPADNPSMITCEANYAEVLGWLGRSREAREHVEAALAVAQRTWPEGHAVVARTLRKKATVLMNAGDYAAAEREGLEAHRQLENLGGPTHAHTRLAARNMIVLYERWGRLGEARRWRDRLAATAPKPPPTPRP